MKTVKHVATSNYCETCTRLEEIKDKVREDGKTRHCSCTCGSAHVWASEVEPYPIAVTKRRL